MYVKSKKQIVFVLCMALCLTLIFTGCSSSDNKGRVYWLNYKPESDEALNKVAEIYEEKTGVKVKIVTAASGTYSQVLNSEMDKSNPPSLIVMKNMNVGGLLY